MPKNSPLESLVYFLAKVSSQFISLNWALYWDYFPSTSQKTPRSIVQLALLYLHLDFDFSSKSLLF